MGSDLRADSAPAVRALHPEGCTGECMQVHPPLRGCTGALRTTAEAVALLTELFPGAQIVEEDPRPSLLATARNRRIPPRVRADRPGL